MYTRKVRAFVGIGSVVAPDSALVVVGLGVAGPVTTPSAAACLPLQVHDLRRVSVIFRQDRLQAMPRDRVDTSTTRSLPFTTTMSTWQRYLSTDSEWLTVAKCISTPIWFKHASKKICKPWPLAQTLQL